MIEWIAFDADDTLWHSETYYQEGQARFADWMLPYQPDRQVALDTLHRTEMANLGTLGYGVKGFAFSMIEAALEVSGERVTGAEIRRILDLARAMLSGDIRLLGGVKETVEALAKAYPLMLITKGDLVDQERKIAGSGLAECFQRVEIVSDKKASTYRAICQRQQIDPAGLVMVGNSLRSDVLPVIELGGWGVHIPYEVTWVHEHVEDLPVGLPRFFEIEHMSQLGEVIAKITG